MLDNFFLGYILKCLVCVMVDIEVYNGIYGFNLYNFKYYNLI